MRYLDIQGERISVIGLGTAQFGSREWGYGEDYATRDAPAIVRRALGLGVNLIDTAEVYGFGRSERIVGESIADGRDGAFVATKLLPVLPLPSLVERQAEGSLRRLGVDQVDLYQLHHPNPLVPLRRAMVGFRRLLDSGLVRHVGVSNCSLAQWRVAERGLGRPVLSNQVQFSLVRPSARWSLAPYAQERGRVVIAHTPLGHGLLSGRYAEGATPTNVVRKMNPVFRPRNLRNAGPLLTALREIAEAHGATQAQVALAWVIQHGNVVAIPGARTVAQLEENVAAADLELSGDEHARLTRQADRYEATRLR
jgi:aryl-alcohol dehydrogenase-like predicted oxidoreductase